MKVNLLTISYPTELLYDTKKKGFDEGMNDLESPTPNNKQLRIGLGHPLPVDTKKFTTIFLLSLEAHIRLDPYINDITLKLNCAHGTLSMEFQT